MSNVETWLPILTAVLGGIFAVFQYWRNSERARSIAAAEEIERFSSDDAVKLAFMVIDWHDCYISYVDVAGRRHGIRFALQDFVLSLRPHVTRRSEVPGYLQSIDKFHIDMQSKGVDVDYTFSQVEKYVRDSFDIFLTRLERIDTLISSGVISERDFGEYFSYWLQVIGGPASNDGPLVHVVGKKRAALVEYIKCYQFNGVLRLFARYGKPL